MPERVRAEVDRWLGSRVVSAVTQPTGFSPGVAARLTTGDGRRVFAKAVGPEPNADAPAFHRREIGIAASLPDAAPVTAPAVVLRRGTRTVPSFPRRRESRGGQRPPRRRRRGWVLLLFEDVDGRHPTQPWRLDQLDRVIAAMEDLAGTLTPSPLPASVVGTAGERFLGRRSWRRLRDDHPSRLDSVDKWTRRHLDTLVAIEDSVADALAGDTLLNYDVRADNILLTRERTWFVDWPHACVGPPWLDVVAFAPSVTMQGGPPPEKVVSRHSAYRAADPDAVTAAVAELAGFFTHQAAQPPPPGLPTLRAFQDAQGAIAREWTARTHGPGLTGLSPSPLAGEG